MSIANEIRRIRAAKAALKSAINAKGGTLTGEILDDYAPAVLNISTGADVSQVTVTAGDILAGKTAVASDGQLITGTISTAVPVQNGNTVDIPAGYLAENYSFTVESGGTDTSDATVSADKLLAGVTAYGASGKVTGTIETVLPAVNGNTVEIPAGFISTAQRLTIPLAAGAQIAGNTVTLFKGYQASEKVITIGTTHPGGVFMPGVKDQEIASDTYLSGSVTLKGDKNLLPGNIRSGVTLFGVSGSYGGSVIMGSMEFYRCAAVYGPKEVKAYQISGCPAAEYNGTYMPAEITTENWEGEKYTVYKHETADLYYYYDANNYLSWGVSPGYTGDLVYYGSGTSWSDRNWNTVDGMACSEVWVTLDADVPKTWDGYKAVFDGEYYSFEDTVTTGLSYGGGFTPKVENIYNQNATVTVNNLYVEIPPVTTNDTACLIYIDGTSVTNQALAENKHTVTFGSGVTADGEYLNIPAAENGRITTTSKLDGFGGNLKTWTWDYFFFADGDSLSISGHSNYGWTLEGNSGGNIYFRGQSSAGKHLNVTYVKNEWTYLSMQYDNGVLHVWNKGKYIGTCTPTFNSTEGRSLGINTDTDGGRVERMPDKIRLYRFSNVLRYVPGEDFEVDKYLNSGA